MKTNVTVTTPSKLNPFLDRPAQRTFGDVVRKFIEILMAMLGGGISRRQSEAGHELVRIEYATDYAVARVTPTSASAADTVTLNGAAMTAESGAPSGDQFDISGTDAAAARSFVTQLNASATAALAQHFAAACRKVIVTAASVIAGDWIQLGLTTIRARTQATDASAGGVRDTLQPDDYFSLSDSDTHCAVSICNCINTHPKLKEKYYAVNSSGAVSIFERPPEATDAPKVATSDGTRLAITSTLTAFADNATILIQAKEPGYAGNAKTIASSNGTRLPIAGSASRLAGGVQVAVTL